MQSRALFDKGAPCASETSMAKYLASGFMEAAEACMTTFGGYGVASGVSCRTQMEGGAIVRTAPSPTTWFAQIAQHALGMPRSY
jgi:acyl-CoA dehydrogenase